MFFDFAPPRAFNFDQKHCMKSVQIWSFFWSVFSASTGKYGPEKTLFLDTFHAVKFKQNVTQIILYYHVTKQFLPCLNWLITCFRFQNMFWKNISCFRSWWRTYTKRWTNSYLISRDKNLSTPAPCGWSRTFNLRIWFGKRMKTV